VSGATVIQHVAPLPAGPIRVAWRTVAGDGHPVEGEYRFTVEGPARAPSAETARPVETITAIATEPSHADDAEDGMRSLPWLVAGVLVGLGGAGTLWLMTRRRATR